MIGNYIRQVFNSYLDEYKQIPHNFCPTKFFSVNFDGWKACSVIYDDPLFNEMISLAGVTTRNIILKYKETHAFTVPQFFYEPKGSFGVKIGLMELELYDKLMGKYENPF